MEATPELVTTERAEADRIGGHLVAESHRARSECFTLIASVRVSTINLATHKSAQAPRADERYAAISRSACPG